MDHVRGCIIGGVIGDAMGGPFEGRPGPLRFEEYTAWSISDDSQLTLATCESIIELKFHRTHDMDEIGRIVDEFAATG